MLEDHASHLLPFVIGVTGHRDPATAYVARIRQQIVQLLAELDAVAPNTPFILLSPLARGCDRIAAEAALSFRRKNPRMRISLVAALPFSLADYRQDFAGDAEDACEFDALLARADRWLEVPSPSGVERDERGFVPAGPQRDRQYRRLGLFVALQSQLVVAMWDGLRNRRVGGTAEIVDFCLGMRPGGAEQDVPFRKVKPLLAPADQTPIVCIPTMRAAGCEPDPEAFALPATLKAVGRHPVGERLRSDLEDLERLNKRLAEPRIAAIARNRRGQSLGAPAVRREVEREWLGLHERYLHLDALAGETKRAYLRTGALIPLVATSGIACFQWFSSYYESAARTAWMPLSAYVILLLVAIWIWFDATRRRRLEWIFVHSRALAEAMRVQLAWTGSEVDDAAPDLYLVRRQQGVRFLRATLRASLLECAVVASRGGCGSDGAIARAWIHEQRDYTNLAKPAMRRRERSLWWSNRIANGSYLIVLLLSFLLLALALNEALLAGSPLGPWSGHLCLAVDLSLAAAVGFGYWQSITLDDEDLEMARRMHEIYSRASELLDDPACSPSAVVRAMGIEAIDEQADWFARHRERLRLPEAG